ncbi:MAG: DNA polymerase III subunit alpha [Anaerolineales bacterium]|nr:DNA polymerase III subunit alpha [Anaerolineales bacterium]
MYLHLTTHSAYSLQEGLPLPSELTRAAAADGMSALGLTDHHLLSGAVEFVTACQEAGVQPVLGLEIDLEAGPLSLLAMNLDGWANLCRLASALALRDDPLAACPPGMLSSFSGDLIALRAETGEAARERLAQLGEIFPGRLYAALQDPARALPVSLLAHKLGLPTVVAHPVHYLTPAQASLQRTLTAIRLNQPLGRLPVTAAAPPGAHFVPAGEIESRYQHFPAALAATAEIAARCHFALPLGVARMPIVPLPEGRSAAEHLRRKAEAGARRLYGRIRPPVRARLDHELEVIARMGYEPIFLIVEEILDFARRSGIPFSSRGSAASSLVAHCLGITSPDPLRLNLYFERFLNPARATPPDIDTDLCSRGREAVIQHVFETCGADRAAMVATVNRFRPRSALGDVAKAHGLTPARVREMVDQLPHAFWARKEQDQEGRDPPSPFADLREAYPAAAFRQIFEQAEALLRLPRHLSVHPGGVVVAPGPLTDLVPVMRSGSKRITITQFDLEAVEAMGLVKIDLLGIRGLTVLGDVAAFIQAGRPQEFTSPLRVLEATPDMDPATSERVESGATIGCFQIESPGMRATLRAIHARSQDDIMAALALYRPGPLSGGLKDAFVRRYKGDEPVSHLHPALAPLLEETFGVILYQEQVLRIAHELASFSLAEADLLRRAMSHFDPGKRMQELRRKFIEQAHARNGIPPETGERVWEMMAAFAGYGFPKAHAASYAQVGWRSAWCKTHFPGEFMAAVLANWGGYYSQRVYLGEARRLGLAVHAPHIHFSGRNFVYAQDASGERALFMGLDQVRGLTRRTIERIVRQVRPFGSLEDFLARVDPRPQEATSLARAGALEGFGTIPSILNRLEGGGWQAGQPSLFAWTGAKDAVQAADWTLEQKAAAQKELLGTSLEAHPLELAAEQIRAAGAITTVEAAGRVGQRVTVAGVRQSGHRSRTAKGQAMMFLTLEDLSGTLDVVLFPDVYRQARTFIHAAAPILVTGVVETDPARVEPLLRAEKVARPG